MQVAKVLALTSFVLPGDGFAGSKPIQGWNALLAKNGITFMVLNSVLLPSNSASGS